MKVAMIGCGKLGAPCANEMQAAGHDVVGYDITYSSLVNFPILKTNIPDCIVLHYGNTRINNHI